MATKVKTTIKIKAAGNSIFCAVADNPRTQTNFELNRWTMPGPVKEQIISGAQADPKARIPVGEPPFLIDNKAIIQCKGRVMKNPASGDDTYHVVLRFYQGSEKVGESDPVSGTFGNTMSVIFTIDCPIKKA